MPIIWIVAIVTPCLAVRPGESGSDSIPIESSGSAQGCPPPPLPPPPLTPTHISAPPHRDCPARCVRFIEGANGSCSGNVFSRGRHANRPPRAACGVWACNTLKGSVKRLRPTCILHCRGFTVFFSTCRTFLTVDRRYRLMSCFVSLSLLLLNPLPPHCRLFDRCVTWQCCRPPRWEHRSRWDRWCENGLRRRSSLAVRRQGLSEAENGGYWLLFFFFFPFLNWESWRTAELLFGCS